MLRHSLRPMLLALSAALLPAAHLEARGLAKGQTVLVSTGASGQPADSPSVAGSISANGRYVVFTTYATNLTSPAGNGKAQIVLRDMKAKTNILVSAGPQGPANEDCTGGRIAANGRYVVFRSKADNLVSGDTNDKIDVFRWDRKTRQVTKVTRALIVGGINGNCLDAVISRNGRFIGFTSNASNITSLFSNGKTHAYIYDFKKDLFARVSFNDQWQLADADCYGVSISDDGRYVAFGSAAQNLDPLAAPATINIYLRDVRQETTRLITKSFHSAAANSSSMGPALSGNGRFLAFYSAANNLVSSDSNAAIDLFRFDRKKGTMERITFDWDGQDMNCSMLAISRNGRRLACQVTKPNLIMPGMDEYRVYTADAKKLSSAPAGLNSAGQMANGYTFNPAISATGKLVAFDSVATNLAGGSGYRDVFLRRP